VSDTPRTDSLLTAILDLDGYVAHRNWPPQWVYYARELERELNAVTSEVERLRKANLQLREGAEEQKQRIKRLEEAGDELLRDNDDMANINRWLRAKEAKL